MMLPLFDMLAKAQNGTAIDQMARQFGLSPQQIEEALAALTPAFSQGLKRNAANPYDLGGFLNALASGQHAKYFEDAATAFTGQGTEEGNGILGHLFGSKELSRAVAAQASQATGIAQQTLQQMLPVLASIIMGGLFKQSTGELGGSGKPLQDIFGRMMQQGMGTKDNAQQPGQAEKSSPANPFDNPFGKMLEGMFGGGGGGGSGGKQAQASQNPFGDLFGNMLEAGTRGRDEYQKNMESIFDQFLQGMDKHKSG